LGTCSGKCENLNLTARPPDTTTSQKIGKTAGKYQVEPDLSATTTTGSPSTPRPSRHAWVSNTTLGGSTIPSGIWTFNITISLITIGGGGQAGNLWITVWNCNTTTVGAGCSSLFKNWDNATNILATASAQKYTFTTGTIGPFSNVKFISVEYWIYYATTGNSNVLTFTETTVY